MKEFEKKLAGCTFIVTGATGFLGSAFVRTLLEHQAHVIVISRRSSDHWRLNKYRDKYLVFTTELRDICDLHIDKPGQTILVHFSASGVNQRDDDVERMVQTNIVGTYHVLNFANEKKLKRVVLIGTSGEYGSGYGLTETAPLQPTSDYGATRASATLITKSYCERRGIDYTILRPFAVYGPYEAPYRLIPYAITQAMKGHTINISSGQQTRDYIYIDDVTRGIITACLSDKASGKIFNICTGVETTVKQAVSHVVSIMGDRVDIKTGAIDNIPGEMWRTTGNPEYAYDVLNWKAKYSLEEGLIETINWFETVGLKLKNYT
ncbi:NAD-dependent epimerase/dehydratase family protein [Marinobacter panjinensis]|uniref:NAD-dependent epimerase/dehydratase family protein n=1 Tax=Marinobacter panjinensis TaxID=2576384 RepID=A0A4U6R1P3_9GAMM|nr:NAD-dependent epimerase/dehydratase family protein [Marinobacter panjinensis]MCR8915765.1 NAD-dependent epimerase/dehydratase family protein [Marinobacter panjinensis]TKV67251.1 NAD-dependent epimerase/dehydratase family protein [Marinobacter panjinensis]